MSKTPEEIVKSHSIKYRGIDYIDIEHAKKAAIEYSTQQTAQLEAENKELTADLSLAQIGEMTAKADLKKLREALEEIIKICHPVDHKIKAIATAALTTNQ